MYEAREMYAKGKLDDWVRIEFVDDGTRVLADVENDRITENQFRRAIETEFEIEFSIVRRQGFWFATGKRKATQ